MRPLWDDVWLVVAVVVSTRATCPRAAVGAVVVSPDNVLLATGYNGAPRGAPHCTEVGCELDANNSCRRVVHAELNALVQAGRAAAGGTLYSTTEPCPTCAAVAVNAGVARVVYVDEYHSVPGTRSGHDVLLGAGVTVEKRSRG